MLYACAGMVNKCVLIEVTSWEERHIRSLVRYIVGFSLDSLQQKGYTRITFIEVLFSLLSLFA